MSNQPIDGVPRDEIVGVPRKLLNAIGAFLNYTDPHGLHDQVWQLLTQPAARPDGAPGKPYGYMFHPDGKKNEEFFIYDAPKERVPDHRGEYWTATPLYAEQPAPAATEPQLIEYSSLDPVERLAVCRGEFLPGAIALTDAQILEVMRPEIYAADGGYVFDTAKENVVAAGRALIALITPKTQSSIANKEQP